MFCVDPRATTRWRWCPIHLSVLPPVKSPDPFSVHLAEQLQQRDQQILLLLEEKEMIFRDMTECSTPLPDDCSPTHSSRTLFRSNTEEALKGGPLMKSAINEGNSNCILFSSSQSGLHADVIYQVLLFYCKIKHKYR